jgi:S-adenosylmethionine decarboxylase
MNGIEWIVEAHGCSPESLSDLSALQTLFERIVGDLQLRPVGETRWHQFPQTGGITGFCLLAESHLACHTFPEFQSLCLNLFCCVARTEWSFDATLKQIFAADSVTVRQVLRPYTPPTASSDGRSLAVTRQSPIGDRLG